MRQKIKTFFLSSLFVLFANTAFTQNLVFSDSLSIGLITCSPGSEVYARFGHSGIRLLDHKSGLDVVFNYGIFDFNAPNFLVKFIRGETDYQLGAALTDDFLYEYRERNSSVTEQVLNLNESEKINIANLLLKNYEPQNRIYRYNFVFDNCATRPLLKISEGIDGKIIFADESSEITFRQWISRHTGADSWLQFGIDMLFGADADRLCTQSESTFLPEVLMNLVENATIDNAETQRKLVYSNTLLVPKHLQTAVKENFISSPSFITICILLIGLIIVFIEKRSKKYFRAFDFTLLLATSIAGMVLIFLMFFSEHPLVKHNLNVLWLNPLNIIAAILFFVRKTKRILAYYFLFCILLIIIVLAGSLFSFQVLNIAFFPIIALLLIRYKCMADNFFAKKN
ncbi:MAG: DUF4105 domain-containing protein [Paludibacter sp.]|jgi:hypothetical protein|nr:DUF4105 domain-containing protein [Paludibacter sp.]